MKTVGLLIGKNGKTIEQDKVDNIYICPFCDKEYKSKVSFIKHLKTEHINEFIEEKEVIEEEEREDVKE